MKVLAVGQHKGGVGKTTVSRLIGIAAARAGHRTLMIDLDGQSSLSQRFLRMERDASSAHESFYPPVHPDFDDIRIDDPKFAGISTSADPYLGNPVYPYPTPIENVDIMPAHGRMLRTINKVDEGELYERVYKRMSEFLADPAVAEAYDLVVIDTPPSLDSSLPESAINASTHVLIPAVMEPQCVEGLQGMLSLWMKANAGRGANRIKLIGIVVNMFQSGTALHQGLLEQIKADENLRDFLLPCMLARRIAFAESDHETVKPDSVLNLSPKDPARIEAEAMVTHVLEAMGLSVTPEEQVAA